MKILHLCLSCFYIDKATYQENALVQQNVKDGHEVLVIASTENFSSEGKRIYSKPMEYMGTDGATVKRIPYVSWLPAKIAQKLRIHTGVYNHIKDFSPDMMLFHGLCGREIITAARYTKDHPEVLFYIDSHEDWYNSARGFISREFLHKLYYRFYARRAAQQARKVLCISLETMDFVTEVYGIPKNQLTFYPLGGYPIPAAEYQQRRSAARQQLKQSLDSIIYVQSGKQTHRKKLIQTLQAFAKAAPENSCLLITGSLHEEIKEQAEQLIAANPQVMYLGWKNAEELTNILCAADVYVQPGTQSVTMQHSMCCHCAIAIDDVKSHQVYVKNNGWLLSHTMTLTHMFRTSATRDLSAMGEQSYHLARDMLDYKKLANQLLTSGL